MWRYIAVEKETMLSLHSDTARGFPCIQITDVHRCCMDLKVQSPKTSTTLQSGTVKACLFTMCHGAFLAVLSQAEHLQSAVRPSRNSSSSSQLPSILRFSLSNMDYHRPYDPRPYIPAKLSFVYALFPNAQHSRLWTHLQCLRCSPWW